MTYFWIFWDTSTSRERFKVETRSLSRRLTLGVNYCKNAKLGQFGLRGGPRDVLLEFWDLLCISAMVKAGNFKFRTQTDHN